MTMQSNLVIDKGADFEGAATILGINNLPVCIHDFDFTCQARYIRNPNIAVEINCEIDPIHKGVLLLKVPHKITDTMEAGDWAYDIEMSYKNYSKEKNRRLKVLRGLITVYDQVTHIW